MLGLVHDGSDSNANGVTALGSSLLDEIVRDGASDAGCGIAGRGRRPGDDIHPQLPDNIHGNVNRSISEACPQYCTNVWTVGRSIHVSARLKRRNTKRVLGKLWAPAVILAVFAIAGYGVHTVRGMSEHISYPPVTSTIPATVIQINPKNVTYEAFGTLGGGGRVTYADLNSRPIEVTLASLPWSTSETTMSPSATLSLVMQVDGDAAGCRIRVDGKVRDEHLVSHPSAAVACTVTAA